MIYTVTLNPALDKEYHVSKLLPNTVSRALSVKSDYGGKGFNIIRMLSELGSESVALGFVGGHTGEVLSDGLHTIGIQTDFVAVGGETRTNFSIISDQAGGYYKVNETGPVVSADEVEQLLRKIENLVRPQDWWVLAGSIPRGVSVDIYARLIECIQRGQAKAVLDSSGEAFRLGCMAKPFLIKPNLEEIMQIASQAQRNTVGIDNVVAGIHRMGVQNIVLSAGQAKSICSNGKHRWAAIPPKIKEKNPTGAGDAMLAAVVDRLSQGTELLEAFIWGIAAGSAAASLPGTCMPARFEVEELLDQVVIIEE